MVKKDNGVFYSHQGWTDIINNLPLINYYNEIYKQLFVVMREDAKPILDYYIKGLEGVIMAYMPKYTLDTSVLQVPDDYDILFHGYHDRFRKEGDKFRGRFDEGGMYFVKGFYEFYDIPFLEKIKKFSIQRDLQLEEQEYQKFVEKYGEDYIVFHDDQNTPGGSTGINLNDVLADKDNAVNLNAITPNLFGYTKILENAKEIHLVDSVWAATTYLLDAKFGLFKDKTVYLYAFKTRGGGLLHKYEDTKIEPLHPYNWEVKHI